MNKWELMGIMGGMGVDGNYAMQTGEAGEAAMHRCIQNNSLFGDGEFLEFLGERSEFSESGSVVGNEGEAVKFQFGVRGVLIDEVVDEFHEFVNIPFGFVRAVEMEVVFLLGKESIGISVTSR